MSHDLRGPLNVIVGLANLLTDPAVAPSLSVEKQQESLQVIHSSGEVLASLIGNILDLSALEAGKVDLNPAPVDADGAFNYLQAMADTLAKEAGRSLVISVSVDPSIRTITVDEDKFMRIMINLISNAVKFTLSGGSVDVVARVDGINDVGEPGLHLVVSDTGVGIPADQHEIIFDPFQRVEGTAFGQRHSSGLGLAVVRELVELHGGRVWVESTPGVGSSFHVHLPYALDEVDDVTGDAATDAGGLMSIPVDRGAMSDDPVEPAPPLGPHTKGMILAVEDTDAHMNLMRLAVTSRGYNMHGVASGEEALKWLEGNRPDVILLDMQLPGIDGFAVASEIRRRVDMHAVPVIAVTADALAANEERARASGCDAYLTKPIDIAVLLATIDRVTA
jgi:CheY-like chemotaxis protein